MQVYRIKNTVNGMSYVGVTRNSLKSRCRQHRGFSARGLTWPLATAIREHGWEKFEAETLVFCETMDEAYAKERDFIALLGTEHPRGYNMTPGGRGLQGRPVSSETRAKISLANQGRPGIEWTPAHRAKMMAARAHTFGAGNVRARRVAYADVEYPSIVDLCRAQGWSRGQFTYRLACGVVKYVGSARVQLSPDQGRWNRGRVASAEARQKMSAVRKGKPCLWNRRSIEMDGVVYESVSAAALALGVNRREIRHCIVNGRGRYVGEPKRISAGV